LKESGLIFILDKNDCDIFHPHFLQRSKKIFWLMAKKFFTDLHN